MITPDKSVGKLVLAARVTHAMFLSTIPITIVILVLLSRSGFVPAYTSNDPTLNIIEMMAGGISLLSLAMGSFLPWFIRFIMRHRTTKITNGKIFLIHLFQMSFFEQLVIYSYVLWLLGSSLYIVISLLILASTALLLTFPTGKRWAKWSEPL